MKKDFLHNRPKHSLLQTKSSSVLLEPSPFSMTTKKERSGSTDRYPIFLLSEELRSENVQLRINSLKDVKKVATAVGPELARTELIDVLMQCVEDEDEILIALSHEIGSLSELIGGGDYVSCLFKPLKYLAASANPRVREQVVVTLERMSRVLSQEQVENQVIPFQKELSEAGDAPSRATSLLMTPFCYKSGSTQSKNGLVESFVRLTLESSPTVRLASAMAMNKFLSYLDASILKEKLLPIFTLVFKESEDDYLTIHLIDSLLTVSDLLTESENEEFVLPLVLSSAVHPSW